MINLILQPARYCLAVFTLVCLFSFKCTNNSLLTAGRQSVTKNNLTQLISEKLFNQLFPQRNTFYSYKAFIKAVHNLAQIKIKVVKRGVSIYQLTRTDRSTGKSTIIRQDKDWNEQWAKQKPDSTYNIDFGLFCAEKDAATNKKELAAFFAHIAHETRNGENGTFSDGLMLIHEEDTSQPYIYANEVYPAVPGKKYYGRGPLQLSYNGNYGYASDCIFGDKHVLLNNPDLVQTDPVVAFETAVYFWMTPETYKPSAHNMMIGKWQPSAKDKIKGRIPGFGMTINIVNGALECNKGANQINMNERIGFYQHFLNKLGISDPNCACSCAKMQPY